MSVDLTKRVRKERYTSAGLPSGPQSSGFLSASNLAIDVRALSEAKDS
jgi:hypothetical protein